MENSLNFNQIQQFANSAVAQKLLQSAPKWIALALVAVIGWQLASIIWALIPAGSGAASADSGSQNAAPRGTAPQNDGGRIDISMITNAHLFGVASSEPRTEQAPSTADVPLSSLNLKLRGTVSASDDQFALAIIADNANREQLYAIGDSIAAATTLHSVAATEVILSRSGRLEKLKLPTEYSAGGPKRAKRTTAARASRANRSIGTESASVRDVITNNVSSLTDVIRPQPYFSGGQQKGYRIYPGKDRKLFADLGLRPGDLVTEINGTPMTDPQQGMQVFRSLGDASSVTVTVERNGEPQTLNLSTDQIKSKQNAK